MILFKDKVIISLISLFCTYFAHSQTYTGDIVLNTQTKIDNFGAHGYKHIIGNIDIGNNGTINDLTPLLGLTTVSGDLNIGPTWGFLINLNGLDSLKSVGGMFKLFQNQITDLSPLLNLNEVNGDFKLIATQVYYLSGLVNLETVGGNFDIINNPLSSLTGLDNLSVLGGELELRYNSQLTSVEGIGNLNTVGGLRINNNNSLSSLLGLESLTHIEKDLDIESNDVLQSLEGLNNLVNIGERLNIDDNPQLASLNGLESLFAVQKNMKIEKNPMLVNLEGLESLTYIRGLSVLRNSSLINLSGLETMTNLNSHLSVKGNANLQTLEGLHNLTSIETGINLVSNPRLQNLDALSEVEGINHTISIKNCDSLISLSGLKFTNISIEYLDIKDNELLQTLTGLEGIDSINGHMVIHSNPNLTNFCPVSHLVIDSTIEGQVIIYDNALNPSIQDFNNLECLTCDVTDPFDKTLTQGGQVLTSNQPNATYQWLNCDSNFAPIANEINQNYVSLLYGNFAVEVTYFGCVDTSECRSINTINVEEYDEDGSFSVFPNPTSGHITFDFGLLNDISLDIRNMLGQSIYFDDNITTSFYETSLDIPSGVYIVEVTSANIKYQVKLIKE